MFIYFRMLINVLLSLKISRLILLHLYHILLDWLWSYVIYIVV
ncbi:unnamed protein product [Trichobilharzia regenti]|nr:unnamed protein product [Trichobilharzia regenti]